MYLNLKEAVEASLTFSPLVVRARGGEQPLRLAASACMEQGALVLSSSGCAKGLLEAWFQCPSFLAVRTSPRVRTRGAHRLASIPHARACLEPELA